MGIKKILLRHSIEREVWTIAIRKKAEVPLYKGNAEGFVPIKGDVRYWRADPFVFKYKGVNYLFAEMLDRKKGKGVIGVAEIKDGKAGKFKVCLDLKYHLSYPCVFEDGGEIYMMPECAKSGKLTVYKSVKFPYKWERCYDILQGQFVDTTPFYDKESGEKKYFTSIFTPENGGNDNLCIIEPDGSIKPIAENNYRVRPAGNLIFDGDLIRPAQDDTKTYGCGLYFYKIENLSGEFKETEILRVSAKGEKEKEGDIELPLGEKYIGVHTYNFNEDYEVIDLLIKEQPNPIVLWKNRQKVMSAIFKKFKGKIGKKK